MGDSIYLAPDIRKQTLEDAQTFIEQKRMRRLITLNTFREHSVIKFKNMFEKDQIRFEKQSATLARTMERIDETIDKAQQQLEKLNQLNNTILNIETSIENG